jgi:hypothetical protein
MRKAHRRRRQKKRSLSRLILRLYGLAAYMSGEGMAGAGKRVTGHVHRIRERAGWRIVTFTAMGDMYSFEAAGVKIFEQQNLSRLESIK